MAKIGDGVPRIIDKAVDFMASSQAFMEYLKNPRVCSICRYSGRQRGAVSASWSIIGSFIGRRDQQETESER
jgi:hypothetical protein